MVLSSNPYRIGRSVGLERVIVADVEHVTGGCYERDSWSVFAADRARWRRGAASAAARAEEKAYSRLRQTTVYRWTRPERVESRACLLQCEALALREQQLQDDPSSSERGPWSVIASDRAHWRRGAAPGASQAEENEHSRLRQRTVYRWSRPERDESRQPAAVRSPSASTTQQHNPFFFDPTLHRLIHYAPTSPRVNVFDTAQQYVREPSPAAGRDQAAVSNVTVVSSAQARVRWNPHKPVQAARRVRRRRDWFVNVDELRPLTEDDYR